MAHIAMTEAELTSLAQEAVDVAVNAGIAVIQNRLGVKEGDFACIYFDLIYDAWEPVFRAYATAEEQNVLNGEA